jgi:hypothetical protein
MDQDKTNEIESRTPNEVLPMLYDGKTGAPFFEYLLFPYYQEAFQVLCDRQKKYGPQNILGAGVPGVIEQARNKVDRARAQLRGDYVGGEIVLEKMDEETRKVFRDSLIDLANYSLIALALHEGSWVENMVMATDNPVRAYGLDVSWWDESSI